MSRVSYVLIWMSCLWSGRAVVAGVTGTGVDLTFVEHMPWHWLCMWPFCVSSDCGKCVCTLVTVTSGQVL